MVFRCTFYPTSFSGFSGHPLISENIIENVNFNSTSCNLILKIDNNLRNNQIDIFPNPTSDYLTINLTDFEKNSYVKIINAQGQQVLVQQLLEHESILNIKDLPKGNYIARVFCGNKIINLKLMKI
jgi:hypothetical protein